jgi:hypothetical protein
MDKRTALRLRRGDRVWFGDTRCMKDHRFRYSGLLVEPFSRHWRDSAPEPDVSDVLFYENWQDCGPDEWIPCQWIYREAWLWRFGNSFACQSATPPKEGAPRKAPLISFTHLVRGPHPDGHSKRSTMRAYPSK